MHHYCRLQVKDAAGQIKELYRYGSIARLLLVSAALCTAASRGSDPVSGGSVAVCLNSNFGTHVHINYLQFNFTRRFNTNKRSSMKIASLAPGKLLFIQLSAHRRGFSLPRKDTCVTERRWFASSPSHFMFPPWMWHRVKMRRCWKGWVFTHAHTQRTHQLVSQSFIHTQPAVQYPNECCFYQQRFPVLGVIHYVSHQLFWERWQFQKVFSSIALYLSFYCVIVIALSSPTHTLPEWVPSCFLSLCSQTNLQLSTWVRAGGCLSQW